MSAAHGYGVRVPRVFRHARAGSTTKPLMPVAVPRRVTNSRRYADQPKHASSYTYRLAAASSAKRTAPRSPQLGRDFWNYTSAQGSPNPPYLRSTKKDSGEDAFFATTVGDSKSHVALGVADGVGGWQDQGIDPSDFSHGLCGYMAGTARTFEIGQDGNTPRPQWLLKKAYDAVISNPGIMAGGSTASLAVADHTGQLEAANLGDSGFIIIGPGRVSFRSPAQTHTFNTPYQLSKIPDRTRLQRAIFGGPNTLSETPAQADISRNELNHGDIVIFATDGVWDNLSVQDALTIIGRIMEEHGYWTKSSKTPGTETMLNSELFHNIPATTTEKTAATYLPGLLATAVMREAKLAGLDPRRDGPFAKEVNKLYPQEGWQGGKADDIAVVVCIAVQEADSTKEKIKSKL